MRNKTKGAYPYRLPFFAAITLQAFPHPAFLYCGQLNNFAEYNFRNRNRMNPIAYYLPAEITTSVEKRLNDWNLARIAERLWAKDASVWKADPVQDVELSNRLGWLTLPFDMPSKAESLKEFAAEVKDRFSQVLVLGMGGSSLAPEVFAKTFGSAAGYPNLRIVDSTHPEVIAGLIGSAPLEETLFVVASKSGGTAETSSFLSTFFDALEKLGANAGSHFVALTDPGSGLEKIAREKDFLAVFSTPPEVGGRYSALTEFGMLPAALLGMDIEMFLDEAATLADGCRAHVLPQENPGLYLGAALGELALAGNDKVVFFVPDEMKSFPYWIEQLVAESTGKEGVGILPVTDELPSSFEHYSNDRVFVFINLDEAEQPDFEKALIEAGKPVISITVNNHYALAQEFFRWEFATAAAGIVLGINPFDQPDVQLAKTLANKALAAYKTNGALPRETPDTSFDGMDFFGTIAGRTPAEILDGFLKEHSDGDYIGILAFVPYGNETEAALSALREHLLSTYRLPVTSGYGPRFLHSTGQLHKGGKNNGLFVQFLSTIETDVDVPGLGYSFSTLITAQAQGDANALRDKGRRLLQIRFSGAAAGTLRKFIP